MNSEPVAKRQPVGAEGAGDTTIRAPDRRNKQRLAEDDVFIDRQGAKLSVRVHYAHDTVPYDDRASVGKRCLGLRVKIREPEMMLPRHLDVKPVGGNPEGVRVFGENDA
jgi:hypothetical protein